MMLKKATEEALDAMEKVIIQEELKKKTSENIVTIKESVEISKKCWNCFDDECQTNDKLRKKKSKNKNEIEKALTTEAVLSATEKASLLESMSKYNNKNKNAQNKPQLYQQKKK